MTLPHNWRDELWDTIARVRDAAPRRPDDADTDDIIDAILDSGLLWRIVTTTEDRMREAVEATLSAHVRLTMHDRPFACSCEPGTVDTTRTHREHVLAALAPTTHEPSGLSCATPAPSETEQRNLT